MARKVFFSFKYEDISRAMIVRNSWVAQGKEAADIIHLPNELLRIIESINS
jgi:hypothetical protein